MSPAFLSAPRRLSSAPSGSRARRLLRRLTSALFVLCAGCGSDAGSGPEGAGVLVTTTVDRDPASPGQTVTVTVRAEPTGSALVRWISITTTGLVEQRDSMAFNAIGPQQLTATLRIPVVSTTGSVLITGSASTGSGIVSSQKALNVLDVVPPVIVSFDGGPKPAAPGDVIAFTYTARDTIGVKRVTVRLENAFLGADTVEYSQARPVATDVIRVTVPDDAAIGFPVMATLTVVDASGLTAESQVNVPIADYRRPVARLDLGGLRADQTIGTGQPLDLHVTATDNHRLTFIGFEGAGLRDSVPASGLGDSHTFRVTVPPSWRQTRPGLSAWARDVSGNVSTIVENTAREIPVFDWVDHPVQTTALSQDAAPTQVLWDPRRNVAYLLRNNPDGTGSNSSIDVIDVLSGSRGTPIPLPVSPQSLALTASGDSLVVTLPDARALGVIDLRLAVRSTVVVPLQIPTDTSELLGPFTFQPVNVQAGGSHVFVTLVHGLFESRLLDINLATGAQVIRSDFAETTGLPQRPGFFRFHDGRLLIVPEFVGHVPHQNFIYTVGADSFTRTSRLRPAGPAQFSSSPSGLFMLGGTVFAASLDSVTTVDTRDWKENYGLVAALSPDGSAVYTSTFYGYQKVRLSDGFVLEQANLGMVPQSLIVLPDGNTLIAVGGLPGSNKGEYAVMIIDLR